jgi:hypothetical protein
MKNKKTITILTFSFITLVLITGVFSGKVFAAWGSPNRLSPGTPHAASPHFYQPIVPPGFPHKWLYRDVVQSFIENGLAVQEVNEVTVTENKLLPAEAKEVAKFPIHSSKGKAEGCVLCFDDKDDLEEVTEHYRELNESGERYNWSFVKDNVLLVITGPVSEEEARQYEKVLYEMKEKEK